jgi:hypothetical protein
MEAVLVEKRRHCWANEVQVVAVIAVPLRLPPLLMQRTFMELHLLQLAPLQDTIVMMSCFVEQSSSRRRPEKCFLVLPKLSAMHYKMFPHIIPKLLLLHL